MMSFDDFEAKIPSDVDFRPFIVEPVRRYGSNNPLARDHWRGPYGYVVHQALTSINSSEKKLRASSDREDRSRNDPSEYYRKKIYAFRNDEPSSRGTPKLAAAIFYWFFRYVPESSYFTEVAAKTWSDRSEVFKRFVFAKCGGEVADSFTDVCNRFREHISIVEEAFHRIWHEDNSDTLGQNMLEAGLGHGKFKELRNSIHLGIQIIQNDSIVPFYLGDNGCCAIIEADPFLICRLLQPGSELSNEVAFDISIQEHDGLRTVISQAARNFDSIENVVAVAVGTGYADYKFGSATLICNNEVDFFYSEKHGRDVLLAHWNTISGSRLNSNDQFRYGAFFSEIVKENGTNLLKSGSLLYLTMTDIKGDAISNFRMASAVPQDRFERIILIVK